MLDDVQLFNVARKCRLLLDWLELYIASSFRVDFTHSLFASVFVTRPEKLFVDPSSASIAIQDL